MNVKTIKRVCLLALAMLLLVGSLAGCGKNDKIDTSWLVSDGEGCVNYFARILLLAEENAEAGTVTPLEKFIAASRGYNMSAEGFDDSKVEIGVVGEVDVEAAKAALASLEPTGDAAKLKFQELLAGMTAKDVSDIVVRTTGDPVDLAEKSSPLVWIGKFLGALTKISGGSYVLSLFFFAIIVEILLLYFGIRQQKNSIKQAKLSPKERAIRKKYAGRKDQVSQRKMQEEIQQLYQQEGFNPMAGCLPLLIQMPIIIALYNIVIDPLRYVLGKAEGLSTVLTKFATTSRAAGGLGETISSTRGTIELLSKLSPENLSGLKSFAYYSNAEECYDALANSLSKLPNFNLFGINMGLTPGFKPPYLLLLVPVLTFVAYFFSMKLTRKFSYQPAAQDPQMGCSNNIMDFTMPLMSVYITFITPAAVGIYWIFKCIVGVVKQYIVHKLMPLPTFTEEDYKRAEREMKGKARPEDRRPLPANMRGTGRSLHSIDDEDDLPPRVRESGEEADYVSADERRARELAEKRAQAENKGKMNGAALKDDRKNKK